MKFEFDIETPEVEVFNTEVKVVCGETVIRLRMVEKTGYVTNGHAGDWIPEWDWRRPYVVNPEDRHGYAFPYEKMIEIATKRAKYEETHRLARLAAEDVARKL